MKLSTNEKEKIAIEYFNNGVKKSNEQDYNGAIAYFNQATEICPNYAIPYYNRAFIKMSLKNYSGAIEDFNMAIKLKPENVMSYYFVNSYHNRARAKYSLKDYEGAIIDFSKAIEENPKFSLAYHNRGMCKIKLNKKNEGTLDLSIAKKLKYEIN